MATNPGIEQRISAVKARIREDLERIVDEGRSRRYHYMSKTIKDTTATRLVVLLRKRYKEAESEFRTNERF